MEEKSKRHRVIGLIEYEKKKAVSPPKDRMDEIFDKPSVYHALVVIFLEFFAWGLLTGPAITVLKDTFPQHVFLINGLIQGIKGIFSFLSAPLVGAVSDLWGRKPFLLLTVTFTCMPIPFMKLSPWWYFALISISGVFAVTFSVVFAYVADITTEEERSFAYGLVSATFAASLVSSPALGAYLAHRYSETFVVLLATAIAALDVLFILVAVPESLPDKFQKSSFSWEKADPCSSLRKIGKDKLVLVLCLTVFLSYLPEAGEYSCFFPYLRLNIGFSQEKVAMYIALVGILSVITQTLLMTFLMKYIGPRHTIIVGLMCEIFQLAWYGLATQEWIMWMAGIFVAVNSMTYPAISAFTSQHASPEQQGVAQGIITGIRGLCNGLGPALFGVIFFLFKVDLNEQDPSTTPVPAAGAGGKIATMSIIPGPPFAFGAVLVTLAVIMAAFIPDNPHGHVGRSPPVSRRRQTRKLRDTFSYEQEALLKTEVQSPS